MTGRAPIALSTAIAALLAAMPVAAQSAPPAPGGLVETVINLAVAEAHCAGPHRETVAVLRPSVMQANAKAIRRAGAAMMQRYRTAHGDAWRSALLEDLHRLRATAEQQAGESRFCSRAAWQARRLSGGGSAGGNFRSMDAESTIYAMAAR